MVRLCLTFLLLAAASNAADLTVLVTNHATSSPISSAEISLEDPDISRRTDSDGLAHFTDLAAGHYRLEITAPGYEPHTQQLDLTATETRRLEITLTSTAYLIDELVVTAEEIDDNVTMQTGYVALDAATLDAIPSIIESDPIRALQALPGVAAASDISSGLYIRGGSPDQNLVLMDGVTVYNPTHAFGLFSTFNNDAVAGISLYKGAYPAEYGGRLGAVVDVHSRQPDPPRLRAELGISIIAARALVEGRAGPDRWFVAGRRTYLDPLLRAMRTPENPIPDYYFYDLNALYSTPRLGGLTTLTFYHGRDDVGVNADVNTSFDLNWGNTVLALRHQRPLSDTVDGRLTLSTSRYQSTTDAEILATPFAVDNELVDVTLSGRLEWLPGAGHLLVLGLEASNYDFSYQSSFNGEEIDYGSSPYELSAFLEDRWRLDDRTALRLGLRTRYLEDGSRWLAEPRLSMARDLTPQLTFKLGAGLYNQYLQLVTTEGFSAGDVYLPIDETADLGRSWQTVVGVEWRPDWVNLLSLEIYANDLDDLVVLDTTTPLGQEPATAADIFVTGGKGYARGAEFLLRRDFGGVTGWFGYTLGWTQRQFDEFNGGDPYPPKYDRRHDLNLILATRAGAWRLGAAFRYASGQSFTPASARLLLRDPGTGHASDFGQVLPAGRNSARLLPYSRLDVSARRPVRLFGRPAEVVIEVFNLYNRRNEWFVQYETDGPVTEATVVRMLPMIPSVGVNIEF